MKTLALMLVLMFASISFAGSGVSSVRGRYTRPTHSSRTQPTVIYVPVYPYYYNSSNRNKSTKSYSNRYNDSYNRARSTLYR